MSVRDVRADQVRVAAAALLAVAGDLGDAAGSLDGLRTGATAGWTGGNGMRWSGRAVAASASGRQLEGLARSLVRTLHAHADEVERAQAALESLDRQVAEVQRRTALAQHLWSADPGEGRAPRPDAAWELAALRAQQQAVEEEASTTATWTAAALRARVPELTTGLSASTVLRAVRDGLLPVNQYGYQLPAGVKDLGAAVQRARAGRPPLLPAHLRVPVGRVLRPVGAALDHAGRVLGPVGLLVDLAAVPAGPDEGLRGTVDYAVTLVGLAAAGVGAVASAPEVLAAAAVVGAVATGAGVATTAWDAASHLPRPDLPRPHLPRPHLSHQGLPGRRAAGAPSRAGRDDGGRPGAPTAPSPADRSRRRAGSATSGSARQAGPRVPRPRTAARGADAPALTLAS
ncbi:MAG: hypothetical protein JWM64_2014 [Frankiales bacterium]|nr:hypothetical protein [Frankiales bacterium]